MAQRHLTVNMIMKGQEAESLMGEKESVFVHWSDFSSWYCLSKGAGHNDSPCILWFQVYSYYHLTPEPEFGKVTFVTEDHRKQTLISKASSWMCCHEAIILFYLPNLLQMCFLSHLLLVFLMVFFLERDDTILNKTDKEYS